MTHLVQRQAAIQQCEAEAMLTSTLLTAGKRTSREVEPLKEPAELIPSY